VYAAKWSPDGTKILTTASDHTARVWEADGSTEPVMLHSNYQVSSAEWSLDGTQVLMISGDGTYFVFRLEPADATSHLRALTAATLTPPERERWLGEDRVTALAKYLERERAHGRSGAWPP
jgi:WD40 repeat protein